MSDGIEHLEAALDEGDADPADVQEQNEDLAETDDDAPDISPTDSPEVDEADAAEQRRTVDLDPDEYR